MRYSISFLQPVPRLGGVVEVDPSNFNRRRWGERCGRGEIWYIFLANSTMFWGCGRGRGLSQ